jgi:3-oxoacyl-[acyl-carrier protein] reductase
MNLNINDKVFIISGSSRGIGKGIADVLLEEGAKVVITGRNKKDLKTTFDKLNDNFPNKVQYHIGDLNKKGTIDSLEKKTLDKWSRVDGLVANAGTVKSVEDWNIPDIDWNWYLKGNFSIAVRFVTHFIPLLRNSNGSIVFVSSIAGLEDIGAPLPYCSSKAALTAYAKGLARKLAPYCIRVNSVAPGNIFFPGGNWDKRMRTDPKGIKRLIKQNVPLGQFGTPLDIGNIVAFLLSEKARFITGSCFVVDGGQTTSFF